MALKIFIDAGHGGEDSGAVGINGRLEKDDNLKFALALGDSLKSYGFEVFQSRSTDKFLSLTERTNMANNMHADLFLSIQRNAFNDPKSNGIEVFIYPTVGESTKDWANKIYNSLINVYAQSQRGVKTGNLAVLRQTNMSAVLLELGFITNDLDNQMFDLHFDDYVNAITNCICDRFNIDRTDGISYQIVIGNFSKESEANKVLDAIKTIGIIGKVKAV